MFQAIRMLSKLRVASGVARQAVDSVVKTSATQATHNHHQRAAESTAVHPKPDIINDK